MDQALLLGKLLRDAGFDARIAGVKLSEEQAMKVLAAMRQPLPPPTPMGDASAAIRVLEKHGLLQNTPTPEQQARFEEFFLHPPAVDGTKAFDQVENTTVFIKQQLQRRQAQPGASDVNALMVEEARDYYWVQFRDAAADGWRDVHPVFTADPPFPTPSAERYLSGEIPAEIQHRLRFQMFIERWVGGRLETVAVSKPWERPVANLIGLPLTFTNVPNTVQGVDLRSSDVDSLLSQATSFVPAFGGGMAEGANYFDLMGNIIDPMAASSAASGVFAKVGKSFGEAASGIAGKDVVPMLTGQWVELTLIAPGGKEQVFRRMTMDRLGAAVRASGQPPTDLKAMKIEEARPLLRLHTMMVSSGFIPRGYAINLAIDNFEKSRPLFDAMLYQGQPSPGIASALSGVPSGWAGLPSLSVMLDEASSLGTGNINYRSAPAVVIHSSGLNEAGSYTERIDIVSNPRRAIDVSVEVPVLDPSLMIRSGIWETTVEGAFLSGQDGVDTWKAFSETDPDHVRVLLPGESTDGMQLDADAQQAIKQDLLNGYAVVVADNKGLSNSPGWWRIHMATGETLGQIDDGRGSVFTEYEIVGLVISMGFLIGGMVRCMPPREQWRPSRYGRYIENEELCCYAANGALTMTTAMIGIWLLPLAGVTAVGAGVAMDYVSFEQPLTGPLCESAFGDG